MSGSELTLPRERRSIDLNADLGEGFANDAALLELVTSANICCGAHTGDPVAIRETVRNATARGVCIGAHPGYADREGFGRREQKLAAIEMEDLLSSQINELKRLAAEVGARVSYLKPHGALYNQAQREPDVGGAVVRASRTFGLPLLGQPGSLLELLARDCGVVYIAEGFPDRRYREDGSLVPRSDANAMLRANLEIEAQVIRLVREGRVATLCIHGDEAGAVDNAVMVREVLQRIGIAVQSFVDGCG
jgi:UPF0271 protein